MLAGRCLRHQNSTCVLCAIGDSVAMRLRENTYLHLYQKQRGMSLTYRDFLKIEKKNEQKLGRKMGRRPEQTVQRKRKENGP